MQKGQRVKVCTSILIIIVQYTRLWPHFLDAICDCTAPLKGLKTGTTRCKILTAPNRRGPYLWKRGEQEWRQKPKTLHTGGVNTQRKLNRGTLTAPSWQWVLSNDPAPRSCWLCNQWLAVCLQLLPEVWEGNWHIASQSLLVVIMEEVSSRRWLNLHLCSSESRTDWPVSCSIGSCTVMICLSVWSVETVLVNLGMA